MIRTVPTQMKKKRRKSRVASCSSMHFSSESVGSVPVERSKKRKKIRSTEDFNHLNRSSCAFELKSSGIWQVEVNKKVLKSEGLDYLPKVSIDDKENSNPRHERKRKSSRKQRSTDSSSSSSTVTSSEVTSEEDKCVESLTSIKKQKSVDQIVDDLKSNSESEDVVFTVKNIKKKKKNSNVKLLGSGSSLQHEEITRSDSKSDSEDLLKQTCSMKTNVLTQQNTSKWSVENITLSENITFEESKKPQRKSVRFLSPEEIPVKKRSTFELKSPTTDVDLLLSMNGNDGTPREIRKGTPFVKKCLTNTRPGATKQKLEYSTDSISAADIDDDVFLDSNVEKSRGSQTNLEDDNKILNTERKSDIATYNPVSNNAVRQKSPVSVLSKPICTPMKTQKKSSLRTSCNASSSKTPKNVEAVNDNSKTPSKFETGNTSLRKNFFNKIVTASKHKSPCKQQRRHTFVECSVKEIGNSPNGTWSQNVTSNEKRSNGPISVADLNEASPDVNIHGKPLVDLGLNSTKEFVRRSNSTPGNLNLDEVESPSILEIVEESIGVPLYTSKNAEIGFNSTKKSIRRSNSATSNCDLVELELPSPISTALTPKERALSIIDLDSTQDEFSHLKNLSDLNDFPIASEKSINCLLNVTQDIQEKRTSGRKRWDRPVEVQIPHSSPGTSHVSPSAKLNNVAISNSANVTAVTDSTTKNTLGRLNISSHTRSRNSKSPGSRNIITSIQKTKGSISKPSSKKKMPNFARIHQMAFEKMEDVQQMIERKAVRAQQLLSGQKPQVQRRLQSPKCRKPLKYSPKIQKSSIPVSNVGRIPTRQMFGKSKPEVMKPSTSNPKVAEHSKPVQKKLEQAKMKTNIPKPVPTLGLNKKPISKLGFKVDTQMAKSTTKEEEVKAAATKSFILKNNVGTRRNVVQNIRSNRRFELLMQMRAKK